MTQTEGQTTAPSGAPDVDSVLELAARSVAYLAQLRRDDGLTATADQYALESKEIEQARTAVAALIARNAELEAALAEESAQLRLCRKDWQRVCDTIDPGVHFDPDEVIGKITDRDALAAENKALREVVEATFKACDLYLITNTGDEDAVGVLFESAQSALARTPAAPTKDDAS